jgi:hypothetical protein
MFGWRSRAAYGMHGVPYHWVWHGQQTHHTFAFTTFIGVEHPRPLQNLQQHVSTIATYKLARCAAPEQQAFYANTCAHTCDRQGCSLSLKN